MLYGIPLIVVFISLLSNIDKRYKNIFFLTAILVLIIFCGLRDPFLYPDIGNYYDFFKGDFNDKDENFGLGYSMLNKSFSILSSSFYFLIMGISILVISSYAQLIKSYSPYIFISLILYITINYYPSFFLLRQYVAMAIFVFSIKYVINRDPIKYTICTLIALSVHMTAAVALPFYALYTIRYSKRNMLLLLVGSVVAILLFMGLKDIVNLISIYYAGYFESETDAPAWQRALMKVYIMMVYLFTLKKHFYDEGINRVVFYSMLINVVICIAAINMYGVFRLRNYYALADFIGIPIMLQQASKKQLKQKTLVYILITIYVILLLISFHNFIQGENMDNQYQFFWNGIEYRSLK